MDLEKMFILAKEVNARELEKMGVDKIPIDVSVGFEQILEGIEAKIIPENKGNLETTCYIDLTNEEKIAVVVDTCMRYLIADNFSPAFENRNDTTDIIRMKEVTEKLVESGIVEGVSTLPFFMYKGEMKETKAMKIHENLEETIELLKKRSNIILYNVQINKYGTIIRFAYTN